MITWLFTQVWLWSLASFLLGALMTWLLFVRPARRDLKAVLAQPPQEHYYEEEPVYDRHHEIFDDREPAAPFEERPLDLVTEAPPTAHRGYVPAPGPAPAAEPTRAEPERIEPTRIEPGRAEFERPRAAAETPPQPEVAEPETEQPASGNTWFRRWDEEQTTEQPEPDPAVTAIQPRVEAAEPDTAVEQARPAEPTAEDDGDRDLSGQLRSLFAPVEGGNPAGETGYIPPVGADATSVLPKVPGAESEQPSQVSGPGEPTGRGQNELPQRTPGNKGEVPQVEPPRIPEALRQRAEAPRRAPGAEPGTGGPANIRPAENIDQEQNLPRRTPGSHPHPGKEAVGNGGGPMIKGHSASRQYHGPDSPQYDEVVADVWFRTPADAETAGFQPWHGGRG